MRRIIIAHEIRHRISSSSLLSALQLGPLTLVTVADFFDGRTMPPESHLPKPKKKSLLTGSTILNLAGAQKLTGAEI
jgi:hypothetical protein